MKRAITSLPEVSFEAIQEISRRKHVSVAWVLREAADEYIAKEIASVSASKLVTQTKRIALVTRLNLLHPSTSPFFACLFRELTRYFEAAGYETRIYFGKKLPQQREYADDLLDRVIADVARGEICGVVPAHGFTQDELRRLQAWQVPIVGEFHTKLPYTVHLPYRQWIKTAVRHLVAEGRQRLALLSWMGEGVLESFRAALTEHGLTEYPEWIIEEDKNIHPSEQGAGWSELREIWTSRREKPDGLIVADDQMAPSVCDALREMGVRVPEQLMMVVQTSSGCPLQVPLPVEELEYNVTSHAQVTGELLLRLIRGEQLPPQHLYGSDQFALYSNRTSARGEKVTRQKNDFSAVENPPGDETRVP